MGLLDLLRPKPIERAEEERRRMVEQASGLSLFCSSWCGYCRVVDREVTRLGLEIERRNVSREPEARRELVAGGGRGQVPCLRIDNGDSAVKWLYESRDIVRYLDRRFAPA